MNRISIISFTFLLSMFFNVYAEINTQFATQRHISNIRIAGLSNAGVSILEGVSSVNINPSLVHSWHWANSKIYSAFIAYEKDSVFKDHIVSSGASWFINEKATIAANYRFMKNSSNHFHNETVICLAGRLFDKSLNQGAVNLGVNIRYESLNWQKQTIDSLPIIQKNYDETGEFVNDSLLRKYKSPYKKYTTEEKRLLFDIGFFQDNIAKGLNLGLTFHNPFGFYWRSEKPFLNHTGDTVYYTQPIDTIIREIVDSSYYIDKWEKNKGRNKKNYKRMTVGISYTFNLMQNKLAFLIPFDLEFIGLFYKKQDTKIGLHTGIEACIINKICVRFGYARAPNYISGEPQDLSIFHENIISGGIGIRFKFVTLDVYMQAQDWGVGCTTSF